VDVVEDEDVEDLAVAVSHLEVATVELPEGRTVEEATLHTEILRPVYGV
jgi:hypothetical protein